MNPEATTSTPEASNIPFPPRLETILQNTLELILPAALKAAAPTFVSFAAPSEGNAASSNSTNDKKETFIKLLKEFLRSDFEELLQKPAETKTLKKKTTAKEDLDARISKYSLLSTEEMDTQIASELQTRLIQKEHNLALSMLSMRMEKIISRPFLLTQNPLQPQRLALHFRNACDKVSTNKKLNGSALQAYLKAMEQSYAEWLASINKVLIAQNILPDLDEGDVNARYKNSMEAQKQRSKELRQTLIGEITGKPVGDGNLANILPGELTAAMMSMMKKASLKDPEMQSHILTGSSTGPAIDIEDVSKLLKNVTSEEHVNPETGYRESTSNQSLAELIKTSTNLQSFLLNDQTQSAIAMLSMMFKKMHEEKAIAAPIKPLLDDLQLPVLKKALADDMFFADTDNAAQQLVNGIAKAGAEWSPGPKAEKDIFYNKLVRIVKDVKENHESEEDAFEKSLQEFNDFMEAEQRRISLIEERTLELEQANARAELAHSRSRGAIAVRTLNTPLPPITRKFIDESWENVLFYYYNKNEEEKSEHFVDALQCLERLVEISSGKDLDADIKALIVSLNNQMILLGYEKADRQQVLQTLTNELVYRQRKTKESLEKSTPVDTADLAPLAAVEQAPEYVEDEFDKQAADLHVNYWFIYSDADHPNKIKIKLAAIIKSTGSHIFVTREGTKILTAKTREIAAKLRDGSLSIISSSPLFDSTLEKVIQSIRAH